MKIPWYTKKQIEHEFYNFEFYKFELERIREDIAEESPPPPDGAPKGNKTGNPTEQKVIAMVEGVSVLALSKTILAIELSLQSLSDEHKRVFQEVYVKGRKDYYALSDDLHISYETLNRRKKELITAFGLRFGIIKA